MGFRYLEGLTMADVAFEADGATLEELFRSAAEALMGAQVEDLSKVAPAATKEIRLEAQDPERLLHDFLQELIFLKDAELLIFSEYKITVSELEAGSWALEAACKGEEIDPGKHAMLVDVKAVSWHRFSLQKTAAGWRAVAIIDV